MYVTALQRLYKSLRVGYLSLEIFIAIGIVHVRLHALRRSEASAGPHDACCHLPRLIGLRLRRVRVRMPKDDAGAIPDLETFKLAPAI